MSSRINARHTTCPGCQEEVFLDELVGGRCPLCGCTLEEEEDACMEFEEGLDRSDLAWIVFNYFIFKRFDDLGVSPLQIMELLTGYADSSGYGTKGTETSHYELDLPMNRWDRLRPKRCIKCGGIFLKGGRKVMAGDLTRPGYTVQYICPHC